MCLLGLCDPTAAILTHPFLCHGVAEEEGEIEGLDTFVRQERQLRNRNTMLVRRRGSGYRGRGLRDHLS